MNQSHSKSIFHTPGVRVSTLIAGVLVLAACSLPATGPIQTSPLASPPAARSPMASPTAPSPLASLATSAALHLTVLHTNDTWGYLLPCG